MRKAFLVISATLLSIIFLNGCDKGSSGGPDIDNCLGVAASFSADVNPIIQTYCNQPACHNSGSTYGPGPLTNYAQVYGARGLIKDQVANGLMPQNATLTNAQKLAIICWVNNGAPNN